MSLLDPDRPLSPARFPVFYGWVVLAAATVGIVMSVPGQTAGVSVFTDDLIAAVGISRLDLSNAYLVGTVGSGLILPFGGRFLDRIGARPTAMAASLGLGLTLLYLSVVDEISAGLGGGFWLSFVALVVGFVALRFSGQGMLTMVSRTMLGRWFDRRRGTVSGISGVFISFGFAAAPLAFSALVDSMGWRGAWRAMAIVVAVLMTLVAYVFYRDRPEDCGLQMDGGPGDGKKKAAFVTAREFERQDAIKTTGFWSVTLALAFQGLIFTGIAFHIVDLGDEAGLTRTEAVAIFLPLAVVGTCVGVVVGIVADRIRVKYALMVMMILQGIGIGCFAALDDTVLRWAGIIAFGAAGGFFGPLSTLALPRYFGRVHLGAISGVQMSCLVVGSAIGPTLFALSESWTGSYSPGLYAGLVLPVSAFVLATVSRNPQPAPSAA